MKTGTGLARYERLIADFASGYNTPDFKVRRMGEFKSSPTDQAFNAVFYGYTEISNTLDALKMSEVLIGLTPPRSKQIKRDEYIQFLIGAYLQEIYILQQRLSAYATKMTRLFRKPSMLSLIDALVDQTLGDIIKTRGSHVHSIRYTDEKLNFLSALAFIERNKGDAILELDIDVDREYKAVQREWKERVRQNNKVTSVIIDAFFDALFHVVSKDGTIVLPRTGKTSKQNAY
jgi:hypothetical protein